MPSDAERGRRWLSDILENIDRADEFTAGLNVRSLEEDTLRFYATVRCLEIISEASRRLSSDLKARYPQALWREMAAADNRYRHEYGAISPRVVWNTVTDHLPSLRLVVLEELAASEKPAEP